MTIFRRERRIAVGARATPIISFGVGTLNILVIYDRWEEPGRVERRAPVLTRRR